MADKSGLIESEVHETRDENHAQQIAQNQQGQPEDPDDPSIRENQREQSPASTSGESECVSVLLESEYFDMEKKHLDAVKFSDSDEKYLSQYLIYMDKKKRVGDKNRDVGHSVKIWIEKIGMKLNSSKEFGGGKMEPCGSAYEKTKVGNPHEFDFHYLMKLEKFEAKVAKMKKMKAKHSNLESKIFFKLYKTENGEEIVAKVEHDQFKETIEDILKDLFKTNAPVMTKKAGPAVKFVLKIPYIDKRKETESREFRYVNIDLTIAYDVSSNHTFLDKLELRSYASLLNERGELHCHFIPAHDFWKLTFTKTEKVLMEKISAVNYKGVCYRAIKILRDEVDVQDALGSSILSSYPIKVTHMKETLQTLLEETDAEKWTKENVGQNVIKLAKAVDKDGEKNQMHGIFVRDDNIMAESDKSYLESRRIVDELKNISRNYKQYGLLNAIIWLVLMIASTLLLTTEVVTWCLTDLRGLEKHCLDKENVEPPFPVNLPFLFAFSILSWIILFANLAGVFLITAPMVTDRWKNVIFKVLPNLRYVYIVTTIASLILVFFDIVLISDYIGGKSCSHLGKKAPIQVGASVSMFITFVPHSLLLISYISGRTYYTGPRKKWFSKYGVMFFEFPFCRQRTERREDEQQQKESVSFDDVERDRVGTMFHPTTKPQKKPGGETEMKERV